MCRPRQRGGAPLDGRAAGGAGAGIPRVSALEAFDPLCGQVLAADVPGQRSPPVLGSDISISVSLRLKTTRQKECHSPLLAVLGVGTGANV